MQGPAFRKSVGLLVSKLKKNQQEMVNVATGFLISPDLVLTAAYNIYLINEKSNALDDKIYFYPGVDQEFNMKKYYKVLSGKFVEKYKQCTPWQKRQFEYCLLRLQKNVEGASFIPFFIGYQWKKQDQIRMYGYQSKNCPDLYSNYFMVEQEYDEDLEKVKAVQSELLPKDDDGFCWREIDNDLAQHKFPTSAGLGGAPIVVKRNGQWLIVGFHIGLRILLKTSQIRQGKRITEAMVQNIIKWGQQMNSEGQNILVARDTISLKQYSKNGEEFQKMVDPLQNKQKRSIVICNNLGDENNMIVEQYQRVILQMREQIARLKKNK